MGGSEDCYGRGAKNADTAFVDKGTVALRSMRLWAKCGPARSRLRSLLAGKDGFTLTELLVGALVGLIVIGGATDFIVVSMRSANAASSRTVAARQAEVFLARLTREVREAQNITNGSTGVNTTPINVTYGGGSSSISFYLPAAGSTGKGTQVTWSCVALGSCTRSSGGASVTELTGVEAATFTPYSASGSRLSSGSGASGAYASSIQLTLSVLVVSQQNPPASQVVAGVAHPITVQDGVVLRNYS